jgi:hypothetical protein
MILAPAAFRHQPSLSFSYIRAIKKDWFPDPVISAVSRQLPQGEKNQNFPLQLAK